MQSDSQNLLIQSVRATKSAVRPLDQTMAAQTQQSLVNVNTAMQQQKTTRAAELADSLVTQPGEPELKSMTKQPTMKAAIPPPPPPPKPAPLAEPLPLSMTAIAGEGQYEDVVPDELLTAMPPPPPPPRAVPVPARPQRCASEDTVLSKSKMVPPLKPSSVPAAAEGQYEDVVPEALLQAAPPPPVAKPKPTPLPPKPLAIPLKPPGGAPMTRTGRAVHIVIPNKSFNVFNVVYVSQSFKNRNDKL
ncbi:hypothetical protein OSTOST_13915 [Ostertagia ostertagi]